MDHDACSPACGGPARRGCGSAGSGASPMPCPVMRRKPGATSTSCAKSASRSRAWRPRRRRRSRRGSSGSVARERRARARPPRSMSSVSPRPSSCAPCARADAAEVEAIDRGMPSSTNARGERGDHLVVHGAAEERVRMRDHRRRARGVAAGDATATSIAPAGAVDAACARVGRAPSRCCRRSTTRPFTRCSSMISSMSSLVDVGVPDLLGVDDQHRALLAAVEAAGLVDAHLARAGELELLDALLGVVLHLLGAVAGAAVLGRVALVEAEEDVVLVEAHGDHSTVTRGAADPRRSATTRKTHRGEAARARAGSA